MVIGEVRDSRFREPDVTGKNPLAQSESDDEDIPLDQAPTPDPEKKAETQPVESTEIVLQHFFL